MKLFLSHDSEDKPTLARFCDALPAFLRKNKWLDKEDMLWGRSLTKQLREAIETKVDYLVIFVSQDAVESGWVEQEVDWALDREAAAGREFILPILFKNFPAEKLPAKLGDRFCLKLVTTDDPEINAAAMKELAREVTENLFRLVIENDELSTAWLSRFSAIEVDPLRMYGFGDMHALETARFQPNCIRALWAHPRGNTVSARFDGRDDGNPSEDRYTITFDNVLVPSHPSCVTIRPSGDDPLSTYDANGVQRSQLVVEVENPEGDGATEVGIAFRLIDRLGTHWSYAKSGTDFLTTILKPGAREPIKINLSTMHYWTLFEVDGNWIHHAKNPNFSLIAAIVIELGGPRGNQRPSEGSGTVIIHRIGLETPEA